MLEEELISMIRELGMLHPPFDPTRVSRVGNAKIKFSFIPRDKLGLEAMIEPCDEGFIVTIDDNLKDAKMRNRLRSTMAHELMHTFFYDTNVLPPKRLGKSIQSHKISILEEDICRYLARQFLMPRFSLRNLLANRNDLETPSLMGLKILKTIFQVSSELIAYRIIKDLQIWDVIYIKSHCMFDGFKLRTLKGRHPTFRKFKIPKYVPSNKWKLSSIFLHHLTKAVDLSNTEFINLHDEIFKFESTKDTVNPLTLATVISPRND
ncbi:MAG: ImmA/IrrE family metallo-endopeptidase, partial [Nitrososphaerales archaeon]